MKRSLLFAAGVAALFIVGSSADAGGITFSLGGNGYSNGYSRGYGHGNYGYGNQGYHGGNNYFGHRGYSNSSYGYGHGYRSNSIHRSNYGNHGNVYRNSGYYNSQTPRYQLRGSNYYAPRSYNSCSSSRYGY